MKIVQLVFHLAAGGAEKFVVDLSNEMAKKGHEVVILMLRDSDLPEFSFNLRYVSRQVRVESLKIPPGFRLSQIKVVEKALEREKPHVIHAHLGVLPFIFRYSLRNKGVKFVHTIHSMPGFDTKSWLQRVFTGCFYKRNITPISISQICETSFEKMYGFKTEIIVNGRNVPEAQDISDSVKAYFSNLRRPVLVHVGRYSPEKNQELLVDSVKELRKEGIDCSLLIIGPGYDDDCPLKASKDNDIHFVGPVRNVFDYLSLADVFCLSSRTEGCPISLIEAFGCGVTPACTDVGGIHDMITNGTTGYICQEMTVDKYKETLKEAITHPISSNILKEHFNMNYSIGICAEKYLKVYEG